MLLLDIPRATNMADDELQVRSRRLKFIQAPLLVDGFEDKKERKRKRIIWTRSWIRLLFGLWRLSSATLGTYPITQVSSHKILSVFAFRPHLIEGSGIIISTGISFSTSSANLFVYKMLTWHCGRDWLTWLISFLREAFWDDAALRKVDAGGCYTHQLQQSSGNNVAGFWKRFKNLQHVTATKCCVKNRPVCHVALKVVSCTITFKCACGCIMNAFNSLTSCYYYFYFFVPYLCLLLVYTFTQLWKQNQLDYVHCITITYVVYFIPLCCCDPIWKADDVLGGGLSNGWYHYKEVMHAHLRIYTLICLALYWTPQWTLSQSSRQNYIKRKADAYTLIRYEQFYQETIFVRFLKNYPYC